MDSSQLPQPVPALSIVPTRIEIVLAEDSTGPLALVSPPLDDINEMAELREAAFSLRDHVEKSDDLRASLSSQLMELSKKLEKFSTSPTLHNRVANVASALGDTALAEVEAERAFELSATGFFARKVGEAKARNGDLSTARSIFLELCHNDPYASLRLASFAVHERKLAEAATWVDRAIFLNPAGYAERLFEGALLLIGGDYRGAVSSLRIALEDKPVSSAAYTNLGFAYLGLHRPDKALASLKRAVALDPFNRSALVALSDVGSALGKDEDVINSLRYFVQFEQKDASIWGRLARSLVRLNLYENCAYALKRQGSLAPSVAVWNNLGVTYARQKFFPRSLQAFKHALTLTPEDGARQQLLVYKNLAAMLSSQTQYAEVVRILEPILRQDQNFDLARDERLAEIYSTYLGAVASLDRTEEAISFADKLLGVDGLASVLAKWIVIFQTAVLGLERTRDEKLELLLESAQTFPSNPHEDVRFINNVAFGLAELDRLDEAALWLNRVPWAIHRDAYVTATLGLISVRKGNAVRGEELYREAIQLAVSVSDKTRIRQKMHVELGRAYAESDRRKSVQMFRRAADEKGGERALRRIAAAALRGLGAS